MILHAILTLASRMRYMISGGDDLEARRYHNRCLEHLIPALSAPEASYDDNLLATITLLKFYEELDSSADPKTHLLGSQRLLNAVPRFCFSGGLAEAASWQLLRAAIYECQVEHEPWHLCLENYERSSVFERSSDTAYANVIIFLVARLVSFQSAQEDDCLMNWNQWTSLRDEVSRWWLERPVSFLPLDFREVSFHEDRPFPELWLLSPPVGRSLEEPKAIQAHRN